MKEYLVILPIAGSISCFVEAVDESSALEKALGMDWLKDIQTMPEFELHGLDSYKELVRGNFSRVDVLEAEVEEQGSDE
jgi:hypothetical protein